MMTLWLCTRCAGSPDIPGLDTCLLIRRDPPGEGCPRGDGAAWHAVNSVHLEPETLIDIACQLAEMAARLITEAHEAAALERCHP
jgi:hypothetical protein